MGVLSIQTDPMFGHDLKEDIDQECQKFGPISKIKIFKDNPEGVIKVVFRTSTAAERCLEVMNGRFFAGRQIEASLWDGVTNYEVKVDDTKRWEEFGEKLEGGEI